MASNIELDLDEPREIKDTDLISLSEKITLDPEILDPVGVESRPEYWNLYSLEPTEKEFRSALTAGHLDVCDYLVEILGTCPLKLHSTLNKDKKELLQLIIEDFIREGNLPACQWLVIHYFIRALSWSHSLMKYAATCGQIEICLFLKKTFKVNNVCSPICLAIEKALENDNIEVCQKLVSQFEVRFNDLKAYVLSPLKLVAHRINDSGCIWMICTFESEITVEEAKQALLLATQKDRWENCQHLLSFIRGRIQ